MTSRRGVIRFRPTGAFPRPEAKRRHIVPPAARSAPAQLARDVTEVKSRSSPEVKYRLVDVTAFPDSVLHHSHPSFDVKVTVNQSDSFSNISGGATAIVTFSAKEGEDLTDFVIPHIQDTVKEFVHSNRFIESSYMSINFTLKDIDTDRVIKESAHYAAKGKWDIDIQEYSNIRLDTRPLEVIENYFTSFLRERQAIMIKIMEHYQDSSKFWKMVLFEVIITPRDLNSMRIAGGRASGYSYNEKVFEPVEIETPEEFGKCLLKGVKQQGAIEDSIQVMKSKLG